MTLMMTLTMISSPLAMTPVTTTTPANTFHVTCSLMTKTLLTGNPPTMSFTMIPPTATSPMTKSQMTFSLTTVLTMNSPTNCHILEFHSSSLLGATTTGTSTSTGTRTATTSTLAIL